MRDNLPYGGTRALFKTVTDFFYRQGVDGIWSQQVEGCTRFFVLVPPDQVTRVLAAYAELDRQLCFTYKKVNRLLEVHVKAYSGQPLSELLPTDCTAYWVRKETIHGKRGEGKSLQNGRKST